MAFLLNILDYLHHQPSLRQQGTVKEVASQLRLCKMGEAYSVQRFLLSGGALNRRTLKRVESLSRNGTPPFHGAKDRPGSPRGGQSALDAHSWWNFILCSSFYRKPSSVFRTVLYIGSATSSEIKVFWVIVENFKICMRRLFISHKETGLFLTSGVSVSSGHWDCGEI